MAEPAEFETVWRTPWTWAVDDYVTSLGLNVNIRDHARHLFEKPRVWLGKTTDATIIANQWALIEWSESLIGLENGDAGMWDVDSPATIRFPRAGLYIVTAQIGLVSTAGNPAFVSVVYGGSAWSFGQPSEMTETEHFATYQYHVIATAGMTCQVFVQCSGDATVDIAAYRSQFSACWLTE